IDVPHRPPPAKQFRLKHTQEQKPPVKTQDDSPEPLNSPRPHNRTVILLIQTKTALHGQPKTMERPPDRKMPRRPMPQAPEKHRDDQVSIYAPPAFHPIAAKRNVKIVSQPC